MAAASQPDFLTRYVEGYAQALADADVGLLWRPAQDYSSSEVGLTIATIPLTPDQVVTLTPSVRDAAPVFTDVAVDLQIRYRATDDIRVVWGMRDAVRSVLRTLFPTRLPTGIYVSSSLLAYGTPLGQDDSRRWEWADLYRTRATETV